MPFGGITRRANWTHEPERSTRHSEVLPFRTGPSGEPDERIPTLALLTSPNPDISQSNWAEGHDVGIGRAWRGVSGVL